MPPATLNEAGYTLVETMAAIALLALAMGSMAAGMQAFGQGQSRNGRLADEMADIRQAEAAFSGFITAHAPFRSRRPDDLIGDAQTIQLNCGAAERCQAKLQTDEDGYRLAIQRKDGVEAAFDLHSRGGLRFAYLADSGALPNWPPGTPQPQSLRAIAIVGDDDAPRLSVRLWPQQPGTCQFDPILQDCR